MVRKKGIAELPLHYGKAPKWLFSKMKYLALPISEIIIEEFGENEFLRRLSNPFWFQAFGCVLGFDWHSSGLTTTVTAALKEVLNNSELNVKVAGGKGKTSRKTPEEIILLSDKLNLNEKKARELVKASKLAAKVDNNLIQDGFQLYHHSLFLNSKGEFTIIQQGMHNKKSYARRYHWLSGFKSFVEEPHAAICSELFLNKTLNLTAKQAREARKISVDLVKENPMKILKMPKHHYIKQRFKEIDLKNLERAYKKAYELQPKDYEELVLIKGIGAKALRALALTANIVYGTELSWKDPAKFSFAHGGKDGIPYPVDTKQIEITASILKQAIEESKIGRKEKMLTLKRLSMIVS